MERCRGEVGARTKLEHQLNKRAITEAARQFILDREDYCDAVIVDSATLKARAFVSVDDIKITDDPRAREHVETDISWFGLMKVVSVLVERDGVVVDSYRPARFKKPSKSEAIRFAISTGKIEIRRESIRGSWIEMVAKRDGCVPRWNNHRPKKFNKEIEKAVSEGLIPIVVTWKGRAVAFEAIAKPSGS